jgi:hypothetical protein
MKKNIEIGEVRYHQKASEEYIGVKFYYGNTIYQWEIPIEYRRTGTYFSGKSESEIKAYISEVYKKCQPSNWESWKKEQDIFWETKSAKTTKSFYDILAKDFCWKSVETDLPPNPNWARRIQDIKEFGYTLATNTKKYDKTLGHNCTHVLLIPLPRGGITGYEVWSKETRERIIEVLGSFDEYEAKKARKEGLLPDHKFPEIRWDENTKRENIESLTADEIKRDFQLLSNQRNLQKREVCRSCYQTGQRGILHGIKFFYAGSEYWDNDIPKRGDSARMGCEGCAWYDMKKWRETLNKKLE